MLSKGADINYRPWDPRTNPALQVAIDNGKLVLVKFLLEKGALPNFAITHPQYKRRPLDSSVRDFPPNYLHMMILLLDHGADPNFPNYNGKTPFFTSVELGHFAKMEILLARGADLKFRASSDGSTVLHEAIRSFRPEMAQFLIEKGHEINCVDNQNRSPLMLAVRYREGYSSYHVTQALLAAGADVNFTTLDGRNALLEAASCGTRDMVQFLIDHGAYLGFIGPNGRNVLYEATHNHKERVIPILKLLLQSGLDLDPRDNKQFTPLLYYVYRSTSEWNREILQTLLDFGASITARDEQQASAMHYAARHKLPSLVQWLAERNFSVTVCDNNGEAPIFWALTAKDPERTLATVGELLRQGADGNHVNAVGQTPLCIAAHIWSSTLTHHFLACGADVNHRDNNGLTPLHWFVANRDIPWNEESFHVLQLLLSHGADVNARTGAGESALDMIKDRYASLPITRMCNALIAAGARHSQHS